MQFHAVKTGLDGQLGGVGIFINGHGNVFFAHGARRAVGLHAFGIGVHLSGQGLAGRAYNLGPRRQVGNMRDAPGVHELNHDFSTLGMHCVGHQPPPLHMIGIEQTGNARVAQPIGGRGSPLGHD